MEITKTDIKTKILKIKEVLNYACLGSINGNRTYLYDVEDDGISSWGYVNKDGRQVWGMIKTTWDDLSDESYETLEKFVKLKTPKEYEVTRDAYLINFKNAETGEIMTVNLKDKKFTKTNAKGSKRDVKYPHTFFRGMDGRIIATKIPANDHFKTLVETIIKKEHKCANMGTFLVRLFDNIHLETYITAGVKFDYRIKVGYDYFDKDVRAVLNKHEMVYNSTVESFFGNNHDLGKSMLYFIKDEEDFAGVFKGIAQNMRDIVNLVENYKYDVKRLFEYCKERNWESGRNRWQNRDLVSFMGDYARMADLVFPNGFDKYPPNIVEWHDGVVKLYEKEKVKFDDALYVKRIDPKLEYEAKEKTGYRIIFPKSTGDIQTEGRMLCHCVGSYVRNIIDGYTTILFMRTKEAPNESLVTVEVRDGRIAQARGKFNRALSYDEKIFLQEYAEKKKLAYQGAYY